MGTHYRSLTNEEIKTLELNYCTHEDWSQVFVKKPFNPNYI